VPRAELACGRVGDDCDLTAEQPSRAASRLLPGPATGAGHQLVCLHGTGNHSPTRCGKGVHAPRSRHVVQFAPWSETKTTRVNQQLVVRGGDSSCEAETRCARRRLVGGGSSSGKLVREAPN
jgi:hypothetical protein